MNLSAQGVKLKKKPKRLLSKNFIIEVIILCIFPYPYMKGEITIRQPVIFIDSGHVDNRVDLCYTIPEFLYVFMFIRILFLLRALFNFTPYQDDHERYY